eukprot:TRINITY_DN839_c0_g2_i2.p1 TRINITY_DN839_c0_g2~~TRINITY_DN839_c0_g2_i2.p1  ORF type:complete len:369 (+),score=127.48 TRINITY_DN839_c0_g2_i2:70-1107(+)
MGQVLQADQGQNTARQAAMFAGIPKEATAFTVNHLCASGLKAILLGAQAIHCGDATVVVAGGMESMSTATYAMPKARYGYGMAFPNGNAEIHDLMLRDGLWESFLNVHMGLTAENIAAKYHITREDQDKLALASNQRAREAIAKGYFKEEIVPVPLQQRRGPPVMFEVDEKPMETSLEKLAALQTVFKKDSTGTVTAGNASGISDGAAAVLLMTRAKALELGLTPLVTVKSYATAGVDPSYMGLGVIPASRQALAKAGMTVADVQVAELNEAFAAQALACTRELGLSPDAVNTCGSGVSLGHPIGCSGARCAVTLAHQMVRRDLHVGLVSLCVGGGQGIAAIFTR